MSWLRPLARLVSLPVRVANLPVKVAAKVLDGAAGGGTRRVRDYDPLALDEIADAVEDAVDG